MAQRRFRYFSRMLTKQSNARKTERTLTYSESWRFLASRQRARRAEKASSGDDSIRDERACGAPSAALGPARWAACLIYAPGVTSIAPRPATFCIPRATATPRLSDQASHCIRNELGRRAGSRNLSFFLVVSLWCPHWLAHWPPHGQGPTRCASAAGQNALGGPQRVGAVGGAARGCEPRALSRAALAALAALYRWMWPR